MNPSSQTKWEKYHHIPGTIFLIGYGSIGRGVTPLIKRHLTFDRFVIIDPRVVPEEGVCDEHLSIALTEENYMKIFDEVFQGKKGFCVNLSVGTSSKDFQVYCQKKGILYIDTVKEEWQGYYDNEQIDLEKRTNYALRQLVFRNLKNSPYKTTSISCCGANPGMVSWFVKQALINLAKEISCLDKIPKNQREWAELMRKLKVKGIQIAENDTQVTTLARPPGHFWNTWSVDGLIYEGIYQPSELGWGTHQKWRPQIARDHPEGCQASLYLLQPGVYTKVKSWCPTPGPQIGLMVTHDESISIADYYTIKSDGQVKYRPSCYYAYNPCPEAMASCIDMMGYGQIPEKDKWLILDQTNITTGIDELGVLIYGHDKNAYWYGSQLSHEDTQKLVGEQNATGLQVSSAVLAGMVWAMENPQAGIVEANEMDFERCLQIQRPYIEPVRGFYTDWNPLHNKGNSFNPDAFDQSDPWQFKNFLINKC